MSQLYQQYMAHLKSYFPTSFSEWSRPEVAWPPEDFVYAHRLISVVNIARLTGESSLLPLSLWTCCRLEENLVTGFKYSDGEREKLSAYDLTICCSARPKLAADSLSNFLRIMAVIPSPTCKNTGKYEEGACQRMARGMVKRMRSKEVSTRITRSSGPAVTFWSLYKEEDVVKLCNSCAKALVEKTISVRKEAWNSLPVLLGVKVPDWNMEAI